ncbi:unnamed protein product, partial [Discosporangium mesarthrocarpum]
QGGGDPRACRNFWARRLGFGLWRVGARTEKKKEGGEHCSRKSRIPCLPVCIPGCVCCTSHGLPDLAAEKTWCGDFLSWQPQELVCVLGFCLGSLMIHASPRPLSGLCSGERASE